jgi:hypothetical protein
VNRSPGFAGNRNAARSKTHETVKEEGFGKIQRQIQGSQGEEESQGRTEKQVRLDRIVAWAVVGPGSRSARGPRGGGFDPANAGEARPRDRRLIFQGVGCLVFLTATEKEWRALPGPGQWARFWDQKDFLAVRAQIDGLWALALGNGSSAGPVQTLFFTAGPDAEAHGLCGMITPQGNNTGAGGNTGAN